jgi:hypothetical protein
MRLPVFARYYVGRGIRFLKGTDLFLSANNQKFAEPNAFNTELGCLIEGK